MKKVLMIGPSRTVHGGISAVVNNLCDAGLDKEVRLTYVATMVEGAKIKKLCRAALAYIEFLFRLPGADLVHVHMASDSSYVRKSLFIRTAHFFRKKILIHQHGGDVQNYYASLSDKKQAKFRSVLSMGDAFVVLAKPLADFFATLIDPAKIIIVPNGVPVPPPAEKNYGTRKLLFLGRICREKGIAELLAAVRTLHEKYPDMTLYLGGVSEDKDLMPEIQKSSDFVKYLGWLDAEAKARRLADCDIFVLPSYFEGQPVSLIEAMAASCAVAATRTGGIPQMVADGETGLLFAAKDEASLTETLEKLLADADLCRRLGTAARERVSRDFSIERQKDRLLEIYGSLWGETAHV